LFIKINCSVTHCNYCVLAEWRIPKIGRVWDDGSRPSDSPTDKHT
jgi:hypothetical protein